MSDGNGGTLTVRQEHQLDAETLLKVVAGGDCAGLSADQKVAYYRARCESAGLDYRAQPFQFIPLNGKLTLYATKAATDQLAAIHGVICEIVDQRTENGVRTVTVRARTRDGRQTDEIGCVSAGNATGDQLCNIHMKCVTKAKRRAVLSICGLGMLDETELETIPGTNAPPSLPPPRRKSEAKPEEPKPVDVVLGPQGPSLDELNAKLDEAASQPVVTNVPVEGAEEVMIEGINEKETKQVRKDGTNGKKYGILCAFQNGDKLWLNTFDDNDADVARTLKRKKEKALIRRKENPYNGQIYWDLVAIAPLALR